MKEASNAASLAASSSPPWLPKDMLTTPPPKVASSVCTALSTPANRSGKAELLARTRKILASGAMAWIHSTSVAASVSQGWLGLGSAGGTVPLTVTIWKWAASGAGRPKVVENGASDWVIERRVVGDDHGDALAGAAVGEVGVAEVAEVVGVADLLDGQAGGGAEDLLGDGVGGVGVELGEGDGLWRR